MLGIIPAWLRAPRTTTWLVLAALLLVAIAIVAPPQLPVVLYKASLVALAAVLGYWARPRSVPLCPARRLPAQRHPLPRHGRCRGRGGQQHQVRRHPPARWHDRNASASATVRYRSVVGRVLFADKKHKRAASDTWQLQRIRSSFRRGRSWGSARLMQRKSRGSSAIGLFSGELGVNARYPYLHAVDCRVQKDTFVRSPSASYQSHSVLRNMLI